MHLQRIRRDRAAASVACLALFCVIHNKHTRNHTAGPPVLQRVLRPPPIRTYSSHSRHQSCEHNYATWSATARTNTVVCVHIITEICSRSQGKVAHMQQLTIAVSTSDCSIHQIQLVRPSPCCCNACRDQGGIQLCKSRAQQPSLALATLQEVLLLPIQATMHTHQQLALQLLRSHLSRPRALRRRAILKALLGPPHHMLLATMRTSL